MTTHSRLSRLELVQRGLAACGAFGVGAIAAACSGSSSSPESGETIPEAAPFEGTLRVLGLGADLIDQVKSAGERELGFSLAFERRSSPDMIERARSRPGSFDVLSGYTYQVDQVWPAGGLISLDRARIDNWAGVTTLYKGGKASPGLETCTTGDGDAPFRKLYTGAVHEAAAPVVVWERGAAGGEGREEPPGLVGAPSTFSLDSVGYDRQEVDREPEDVSWADLFNASWRGRTALYNDPSFGLQTAALASEALGLMRFGDKGNMTAEEIDSLVAILTRLKRRGQFRTFWSTFDESVDLMAAREVVLQYMWYPAVGFLQALGRPVHYAAPQEGYLAWAGLLMFSRNVLRDPSRLQACYDYANWWQAGLPGAILLPFGYYNAVMDASRPLVLDADWGYWIAGEAAPSALDSPFGADAIREGERRDGGSLQTRACRLGTWLSFFDEQAEHQSERWGELVAG